jgi:hypothetical protein
VCYNILRKKREENKTMTLEKMTMAQALEMGWECVGAGKGWSDYEDPKGQYGVTFYDGEEFGKVYEF